MEPLSKEWTTSRRVMRVTGKWVGRIQSACPPCTAVAGPSAPHLNPALARLPRHHFLYVCRGSIELPL